MKNRSKIIIVFILIIVIGIITYSWFNVRGREIDGVLEISSDCLVRIKVGNGVEREYILNDRQIDMLRTLILESSFTKIISYIVTYPPETEHYTILIDWNNKKDFLNIYSIGGKYISIPNQFNGMFLKINNPQWETSLKEIIFLSEQS